MPFSARFETVELFPRRVYLSALLLAAASFVVLIAPVAYHRLLFAQRQKPRIVRVANRFAICGLGLLCLAPTAVLLLVADLLMARGAAVVLSAAFGLLTATLWFMPALLRRRR